MGKWVCVISFRWSPARFGGSIHFEMISPQIGIGMADRRGTIGAWLGGEEEEEEEGVEEEEEKDDEDEDEGNGDVEAAAIAARANGPHRLLPLAGRLK